MVIDVLSSLAFNTEERKKRERGSWTTAEGEMEGRRYRRDKKNHNDGGEEKERVGEGNRLVSPACLALD